MSGDDLRAAARLYRSRGWSVVLLASGTKRPVTDDWPSLEIDDISVDSYFTGDPNIGVQLGAKSRGLTDVDLDADEAVVIGAFILPPTDAIFGRKSKRDSHRLYVTDLASRIGKAALVFDDPAAGEEDKKRLCELRIGGAAAQTMFPPSRHPEGERVEWESGCDREPATVDGARLVDGVSAIAAGALILRYWPGDGRHDLALILGGVLARSGWDRARGKPFVEGIARAAGYSKAADLARTAGDAIEHFRQDPSAHAFGRTKLEEIYPQFGVARRITEWLGYREPRGSTPKDDTAPPPAPFVLAWASDLQGKPVFDREWLVSNIIPGRNVTLFSGDGGVGKSTLSLQLAAAVASEQWGWIGRITSHGNVVAVLCEDDDAEVHRRLAAISEHMRLRLSDLSRLSYSVRVGADNLLMHFDRSHVGKTTPFYDQIGNAAAENHAALLVLDSLHDFYAGDEINRTEARQFIGALRAICTKAGCAVVLLGHPSQAGMANETGTSGSTGWNNTVRSRCYLHKKKKKKKGQDDEEEDDEDDDTRILEVMKSNYGPPSEAVDLVWEDGVFLPVAPSFDSFHEAEPAFLDCLDETVKQGRYASEAKNSPRYAPRVFAKMRPLNRKRSERQLAVAMEALFTRNLIRVGGFRGADRHSVPCIERVPR